VTTSTTELLDFVLAGGEASPRHIDDLVRAHVPEDHIMDYKVGKWLADDGGPSRPGAPTKAKDKLRQMVTGFANGDGGVLIVGVADDDAGGNGIEPWTVTGCDAPGKEKGATALSQWVLDVLSGIMSQLVPAPRVTVVQHDVGLVLVVAVHRAPGLIPVRENGVQGYYLRFGDGTYWIPPYLHADLVLGRRSRPVIRVSASCTHAVQWSGNRGLHVDLRWHFTTWNEGFVWADDLRVGVLGWQSCGARENDAPVANELRAAVDDNAPSTGSLRHHQGMSPFQRTSGQRVPRSGSDGKIATSILGAGPFESRTTDAAISFDLPAVAGTFVWSAAVYQVSRDALPRWHQLRATVVVPEFPSVTEEPQREVLAAWTTNVSVEVELKEVTVGNAEVAFRAVSPASKEPIAASVVRRV